MKRIPIQLLQSYKKSGRSTAFLIRIQDNDNEVHGYTTLNRIVHFDDGGGVVTYHARNEMNPQNIQNTSDLDVDNTELHGWFDDVTTNLLLAGKFSNAKITVYRINYLHQEYGAEIVSFGTVGKVDYSQDREGKRKIEWKGFTDLLKDKKCDQFSLTCRNDFGDDKCGMPFVWEAATIGSIEDNRMRFQVTGITRPDYYYSFGVMEFLDGPNATAYMEIENWTADGWITLTFVTPFALTNGTAVRLRRDCDKLHATCIAYGNVINMNAEHLTPTENQSVMVPGAYIRSSNAL